jgi:phosphate transport system protein
MTHLETELKQLKNDLLEMWSIVISQIEKSKAAIEHHDLDLVKEVKANEKLVDAFELKIDMDCENLIALENPVAVDLRFVLSVLKINYNIERIGDYANYIANTIKKANTPFERELLEAARVLEMFDTAHLMLIEAYESFEQEDNKRILNIFDMDEKLDEINKASISVLADYIAKKPEDGRHLLEIFSIIRKLERVGDHLENIAEEMIFFLEAKIIKHKKLSKNKQNPEKK